MGFGFDSRTKDCKVVMVLRLLENENEDDEEEEVAIKVEIFSLNRNSWKSVTSTAPKYDFVEGGSQPFLNGAVHWVATQRGRNGLVSHNLVLALDMGTEHFQEFMLPEHLAHENAMFLTVSGYKDSTLAVFRRNYIGFYDSDIWLMKQYGVTESWIKLLTVCRYGDGVPRALGFRRNGEVLFELCQGEIASVNLESLEVNDLRIHGASGFSFVDTFVESLVLLDRPINASIDASDEFLFLT